MGKMGTRVGTNKLKDDAVTSAKIKDDEIVNADINSAAAIAYSKLATDPRIARIKAGTYTGDGVAGGQAITGIGFQPIFVWMARHYTDSQDDVYSYTKVNGMTDDVNYQISNSYGRFLKDYGIMTLDSDGFTVKGATANDDGVTFIYIALG